MKTRKFTFTINLGYVVLVVILLAQLAGCANLKFQWAASYQTDNLAADVAAARAAQAPVTPQLNLDEVAWIKNTLDYLVANPAVHPSVDQSLPYRDLRRQVEALEK